MEKVIFLALAQAGIAFKNSKIFDDSRNRDRYILSFHIVSNGLGTEDPRVGNKDIINDPLKYIFLSDTVSVFQVIVDDSAVQIVQVALSGFFIRLFQCSRESAPDQVITDLKTAAQLISVFYGLAVYKWPYAERNIAAKKHSGLTVPW